MDYRGDHLLETICLRIDWVGIRLTGTVIHMNNKSTGIFVTLISVLIGNMGCSSVTSEKRVRHSVQTHYSVGERQFSNSISHVLGPPLVDGNRIDELRNGDQVFPAMLEAIRGAQKTITLESYIWKA